MQSLQSRVEETTPSALDDEPLPVAELAEDLQRLNVEILALYKASLPPAVIHQIGRSAREQAAIAQMMFEDCERRAQNGSLNRKHVANAKKWNAGVRRWIENRQTAYTTGTRRKLCIVRNNRAAQ